jgi:hypothetical protein
MQNPGELPILYSEDTNFQGIPNANAITEDWKAAALAIEAEYKKVADRYCAAGDARLTTIGHFNRMAEKHYQIAKAEVDSISLQSELAYELQAHLAKTAVKDEVSVGNAQTTMDLAVDQIRLNRATRKSRAEAAFRRNQERMNGLTGNSSV